MKKETDKEYINLSDIYIKLLAKKKLIFFVWIITFVVSVALVLPIPRMYDAETSIVPESTELGTSSLSSIASSFGFNIDGAATTDAFYPDIYPDVLASNDFIVKLLDIQVENVDKTINTDYFTYLKKHQKTTPYMVPFIALKKMIMDMMSPAEESVNNENAKIDIFRLSKKENDIFNKIKSNISCNVDKKTGVVTISVVDQDALICATIADSVRVYLQRFITDYRTNKSRLDYEYYSKLTLEAKSEYEKAAEEYAKFCDSHNNSILESVNSKRDELENNMSIKLNTYNTMSTQLVAAKAKVQESTPAFSVLSSPTVPVKASSPKRMLIIGFMLILSTMIVILYIIKDEIFLKQKTTDESD